MSTYLKNAIIGGLPDVALRRLQQRLQPISLSPRQILHERNEKSPYIYFPNSGVVSLVVSLADGFQAEVGPVGREGIVGLGAAHGIDSEVTEAVVRVPGEAVRMRPADFAAELEASPEFRLRMRQYADAARAQAMQIAVCNNHHSLEQRLARWLLMVMDRSGARKLPVTQEILAATLGVHRPSLSATASRLQRAGIILTSTGHVSIVDVTSLEGVSCECRDVIDGRYGFGS